MKAKIEKLNTLLARSVDLSGAGAVLDWDQETYMPDGGGQARADQLSTLSELAHRAFTDEEVGSLLEDLNSQIGDLDYDSDEASIIREAWRDYQKQVKVPATLVAERAKTSALGLQAWKEAREKQDFSIFEPLLDKQIDLTHQYAEALGHESGNTYDALLDDFDPGLTTAYISEVFGGLRPELVELVAGITANADAVDNSILRQSFDIQKQIVFNKEVIAALGYDFNRGRLDESAHPFTIHFGRGDVRLTTRFFENDPISGLMSSIHEAGHGMYEQNTSASLYRTRLANGSGMSVHESQSRYYENVLGRSRGFWSYWYPKAQETFAPCFDGVDFEDFYKALNKSEPSLIRVEADEVTYGLHIMLRFELEQEIFAGKIKTADLPKEWNARMEAYLGVVPSNDSEGVMQDIHWAMALFGYFPDYLLGSIMSTQLSEKLSEDIDELDGKIGRGEYSDILAWQVENIHQHGSKFTFPELMQRVTGGPLRWEPYMDYLKEKYSDIYGL